MNENPLLHTEDSSEELGVSVHSGYPCELAPKLALEIAKLLKCSTDAPMPFLITVGLVLLSVLAGRSITVLNGILLNEYYVLVGRTGLTRKTTVQAKVIDFLIMLLELLGKERKGALSFVSEFSVEGLRSELNGKGKTLLLVPTEYKQVFDIGRRQNQGNTISTITGMYDCNPIKARLAGQVFEASDYSLSILGCSTPSWFQEATSGDNIAGGFLNRHNIIFCPPADRPLLEPSPVPSDRLLEMASELSRLAPDLKQVILQGCGPGFLHEQRHLSLIGDDAQKLWRNYLLELYDKQVSANERACDLLAREHTHAIKMAGNKAFGDRLSGIDDKCLQFGIQWARASSTAAFMLAGEIKPKTKKKSDAERLALFVTRKFQEESKAVGHREIAKHFGGDQKPWHKAAEEALKAQLIVSVDGGYIPSSVRPTLNEIQKDYRKEKTLTGDQADE